jgi:tetratricopeptide (TPR) repeat protein
LTADSTGPLDVALGHATRLLDRRPDLAEQQAREILAAVPGHPAAILIQGTARRRQGDAQGAADILRALAESEPKSARTQYELGLACAALGEDAAALMALRRAVALDPRMGDAWRVIGDMLTLAGDGAGADAAYAAQIRAAVNDAALMRAADALCGGRLDVAERLLRDRLKAVPTDVAAMRMLAEAGTRLGRYTDAEHLLERALELAPSFIAARHNLAIVLFRQHKAAQAIPHIERLLAHDALDTGYRNLLAASLANIGDYARAIALYEELLREAPRLPKLWLSYGHALKTAGRRDDSVRAYRACIDVAPTMGEAWWSLANLKTERFSRDDIDAMQAQLARATLTDDKLHFHYALGHALEIAGDYQASFAHYQEGARLRRADIGYDADDIAAQVAATIELFTSGFFAARDGVGCPDPAPIFIVGLPRAGSTLLEQILASHGDIEGTMELPEIANIAREVGKRSALPYPSCLAELPAASLAELGARYMERTRIYRRTGKRLFIDKMPNNWIHAGLIHLILPNAKIIDARRHPAATCFSAFKQHFARGQHFSYDLAELGRYYNGYVACMAGLDVALPDRVHRVQYETMVADTDAETRRLLAYCGVAFEPACLRFWESGRPVRTASSEQVRRPIYREGLDHWTHYKPWLGPLLDVLEAGGTTMEFR